MWCPSLGLGEGSSVQFSHSVVSDSLRPHGPQHTRPPCLSPMPESTQTHVHQVVMPSNYLILCQPLLFLPSVFPSIRVFSSESVLHIIWPKYWSFSFSIRPSKEYSGLISFKIDFLISLQSKGLSRIFNITVESVRSLVLNLPYGPTLTSIHDYWEKT